MHRGVLARVVRRLAAVTAIVAIAVSLASACSVPLGPGLGSISGRVTIPDGVELGEETFIDLYLYRPGDDETDSTSGRATARPDGTYRFLFLPPGDYTVFVSVYDAGLAPQWWGGATSAQDADVIHLEPGEQRGRADVELVKGVTLAGTISMPPTSKRSPEHVWVTVWDARERIWKGDSAVSPDGDYAVRGLAAGEYKIEVAPPRGRAARQWWGGASDWTGADIVTVGASAERAGLDVALAAGGTISGIVRGEAAREYGATVYSWLLAADGEWEQGSWAESDPDGTYRIRGVAPGIYAVSFSRPIRERPWDDADTAMRRQSSEAEPSHEKYWDDKPDLDSADLVVVGEGEKVTGISADLDVPPSAARG